MPSFDRMEDESHWSASIISGYANMSIKLYMFGIPKRFRLHSFDVEQQVPLENSKHWANNSIVLSLHHSLSPSILVVKSSLDLKSYFWFLPAQSSSTAYFLLEFLCYRNAMIFYCNWQPTVINVKTEKRIVGDQSIPSTYIKPKPHSHMS